MTVPLERSTRAAPRGARLRETELRVLLFAGDVGAAALAAVATPPIWATINPDFAPHVDLRLMQAFVVLIWIVLLRMLGGGDLPSPRFGRRTLAAVSRSLVASTVIVF